MWFPLGNNASAPIAGSAADSASPFMQSIMEMPLCGDCETFFKGLCIPSPPDELPINFSSMSERRSKYDQIKKGTPESCMCSMCFCIGHLLPVDMLQSTEVVAILQHERSTDCIGMGLLGEKGRMLGSAIFHRFEQSQSHQAEDHKALPAPIADFTTISRLIRDCEEEHCHGNWNLPRYQSPTSIQLIDVEDMAVISATTQLRYVALSYVWGGGDSFVATKETRVSLGDKGGLNEYMDDFPLTIKDSMEVVRILGERYLWVDRICIEQDNDIQKKAHIQKMDIIYSHALVTIIAYDGLAATSPLPGLRPGTRLGLPTKRVGDIVMSIECPDFWQSDAPHEKRGWTLQEQLLSKRCLYFDNHRMWFQCAEGIRKEDRPNHLLQTPPSLTMHDLQLNKEVINSANGLNNVWDRYVELVRRYRGRHLGMAEDMVYAFQGIAQIIADSLETPLISAVPLKLLPRALQFYFQADEPGFGRLRTAPSWSWAGWKSSITFASFCRETDLPADAVQLEMGLKYKPYTRTGFPDETTSQPDHSELENPIEETSLQTPLYLLLDIDCLSIKAGAFKIKERKAIEISIVYIHDQTGAYCGYTSAKNLKSYLSEENYDSDQFRWILLSKSQPTQLRETYAFEVTQRAPWSIRDIMLIRWSERHGFWERVCVAHIYQEAWEAAGPIATKLLLG